MFRNRLRQLTWLVCLSLLLPITALAQTSAPTSAPAPLSTDAKEAINKGILAAKQQDYLLAIRYFQDARKIAPDGPEIYFDLGLAESKIPGRELRAIAWFAAYLAANPNAANAPAVKDQIRALDVKSRSDVFRLIKSIQDQDFQGFSPDDVLKAATSWNIAKLWAAVGDFAAALKVANLIRENQGTSGMKSASLSEVAEFQANAGDIAGALSTSAAALKIADKIHDDRMPYLKSLAQRSIAEAQVKAGDIAGAQNTLAAALKNANQIREADRRSATQTAIAVVTAEAQVKAGDITGAQSTLAAALKTANQIRVVDDERWTAQTAVAEAQVKAGDIAGAQSALAAALKSADQILGDYSKRDAQVNIALVRPIVPIITAADWLNKLDDTAALNSDPFMDLAGYVRARTKPDEPLSPELVLTDTANAIVKAQNLIDGMLKQQAKQQARP